MQYLFQRNILFPCLPAGRLCLVYCVLCLVSNSTFFGNCYDFLDRWSQTHSNASGTSS